MLFKLEQQWYGKPARLFLIFFLPFSYLFSLCSSLRRYLYRKHIFKSQRIRVPVIVVGNIVVGGTGKTPFVLWLVHFLKAQGYRPGIISRGVGGKRQCTPVLVTPHLRASDVGDEALLLARNAACPIVISVDRVATAEYLLQQQTCDIIVSDDGLQHYRLQRDLEIAIVDGARRFGNQQLLPAGPLREPIARLQTVDFVVVNGGDASDKFTMNLVAEKLISVSDANQIALQDFPRQTVHAIAAIGNPERFFMLLERLGFKVIPHVFRDHYLYQAQDFKFNDELPILMTEKDAVKCQAFANKRYWYLPVSAILSENFVSALTSALVEIKK